MKVATREEWLNKAVRLLNKSVFVPNKFIPPQDIKVSCGFPSMGAFASKRRRIGECWYPQTGKSHQLFISPVLVKPIDVLDVLSHEVVHTIAGSKAGHKAPFRRVATAIGLEGKMTATVAGPRLKKVLAAISEQLGVYPHESLSKYSTERKTQGTRLLKAACEECGYTIRITAKWIEEVGLPICPGCDTLLTQPD